MVAARSQPRTLTSAHRAAARRTVGAGTVHSNFQPAARSRKKLAVRERKTRGAEALARPAALKVQLAEVTLFPTLSPNKAVFQGLETCVERTDRCTLMLARAEKKPEPDS